MKPIAVFDIDGTIFRSSLVIELTRALVKHRVFPPIVEKEIEKQYIKWTNRKGSYEDYIDRVVEIFEKRIVGCSHDDVKKISKLVILEQREKVYRFTRDLIKKLKGKYILVAISGSPLEIVEIFADYWKFDYYFGTLHPFSNGKNKIYDGSKIVPASNKSGVILDLVKKVGLSLKGSIGVGDTENDVGLLETVEKPICFNPNKKLYTIAKKKGWKVVVERKDVIYQL